MKQAYGEQVLLESQVFKRLKEFGMDHESIKDDLARDEATRAVEENRELLNWETFD